MQYVKFSKSANNVLSFSYFIKRIFHLVNILVVSRNNSVANFIK